MTSTNGVLIVSTDVTQITWLWRWLPLRLLVNVSSNSPSQDYTHPDDRTLLNDQKYYNTLCLPFKILHKHCFFIFSWDSKWSQYGKAWKIALTLGLRARAILFVFEKSTPAYKFPKCTRNHVLMGIRCQEGFTFIVYNFPCIFSVFTTGLIYRWFHWQIKINMISKLAVFINGGK